MALRHISFEEMAVDRVAAQQQFDASHSEVDGLYTETQASVAAPAEEPPPDEPPSDEGQTPLPEAADETDESLTPAEQDPPADTANEALEAFIQHHRISLLSIQSQREVLAQEGLLEAGSYVGGKAVDGLTYLKEVGVEYGPTALKHLYKGILYALEKTLKALTLGAVAIQKYVKKRMASFTVFKAKIAKAREALQLLSATEPTTRVFNNAEVLATLTIGSSVDISKNLGVALTFYKGFFSTLTQNVSAAVSNTQHLIDNVVHERVATPSFYAMEPRQLPGLVLRSVAGYEPDSAHLDSWVYPQILPGNVCFMGHFPKKALQEVTALTEACAGSKLFFGMQQHRTAPDYVSFMAPAELDELLTQLDAFCEVGLGLEATYQSVLKTRSRIKASLPMYTRYLMGAQGRISIRDSLAELITAKVAYLDHTYISASLKTNDYVVRLLSAGLTYVNQAIRVYA